MSSLYKCTAEFLFPSLAATCRKIKTSPVRSPVIWPRSPGHFGLSPPRLLHPSPPFCAQELTFTFCIRGLPRCLIYSSLDSRKMGDGKAAGNCSSARRGLPWALPAAEPDWRLLLAARAAGTQPFPQLLSSVNTPAVHPGAQASWQLLILLNFAFIAGAARASWIPLIPSGATVKSPAHLSSAVRVSVPRLPLHPR